MESGSWSSGAELLPGLACRTERSASCARTSRAEGLYTVADRVPSAVCARSPGKIGSCDHPARILVPGYYGEGSVKWINRIELYEHPVEDRYYGKQGWKSEHFKTVSRFDSARLYSGLPSNLSRLSALATSAPGRHKWGHHDASPPTGCSGPAA